MTAGRPEVKGRARVRPRGKAGGSRALGAKVGEAGEAVTTVLLTLAMLCLGIVALVALTSSVWLMFDRQSGNLTQSMSLYTVQSPRSWGTLALGLLGGAVVTWTCWLAWRHGSVLDGPRATIVLVVVVTTLQVVLVLALGTRGTAWGDSRMVDGMARQACEDGLRSIFRGPYGTLFSDARLYFACYPFQATFFWLLYGLRLLFGDLSYVVLQLLQVAANALAVVCLLDVGKSLMPSAPGRRVLWVLVALCLPMYLLATFLYLNALGFGLSMAFVALQARSMRSFMEGDGWRRPVLWCVASLPPLALSLCVKATFLLFAIGVLLTWAQLALRRRDPRALVACVCVVALAHGLSAMPFQALRAASGDYPFGDALTTLNHLELGLRMGTGEFYVSCDAGRPTYAPGGWSNHANAIWEVTGQDARGQNALALRFVAQDMAGFASDPSYALWFFSTKLATEWADPTYQTLYYLSQCLDGTGARACNPADESSPLGFVCVTLTYLLDGFQSVTLVAAAGAVASVCRRRLRRGGPSGPRRVDLDVRESMTLLLGMILFAGFGCYLLWEAKSVYVLPFAIVTLPLAASGLGGLFERVSARAARTRRAKGRG